MKGFAITGVCGFVAPRHLQAIRETGGELLTAHDRSDSAGILDQFFPGARFSTNEDSFWNDTARLAAGNRLHYLSVCTPNHHHEPDVIRGLKSGLDVICEKPLVVDPSRAEAISQIERETGGSVFNVLQLRLHPGIRALRDTVKAGPSDKKADVDLTYITPRGRWYHESWKGREELSGGIATNIGIHFFDMLIWIFGPVQHSEVHLHTPVRAAGFLELASARVRWFLSIRAEDLPAQTKASGGYSHRAIDVDGRTIEFTTGFESLHTASYAAVLAGQGFPLMEAYPSLELAARIRGSRPVERPADYHPFITSQD